MDITSLPEREFILGDVETIGVKNVRSRNNASLNGTTGTVSIFDSTGTEIITDSALTIAYNVDKTSVQGSATLTTGSGWITSTGTYRAIYKLTFPDGAVKHWEQQLTVKANPF